MLLSIKITNWKVSVNPNLIFLNGVISLLYFNKIRVTGQRHIQWIQLIELSRVLRFYEVLAGLLAACNGYLCTSLHGCAQRHLYRVLEAVQLRRSFRVILNKTEPAIYSGFLLYSNVSLGFASNICIECWKQFLRQFKSL